MNGVLAGFAALTSVVALGWLLGRAGALGADAAAVLSRLSFLVAMPTLLFLTTADADPSLLLSSALVGSAGSAVLVAVLYAALARVTWRLSAPELAAGALASSYVNAGNLGIPVAAYVLGDASHVAPVLLFQVLLMAPVGLAALGAGARGQGSRWRVLTLPVRTPLVIGALLGLVVGGTGLELPTAVLQPVELVAGLAVPAALLAYGLSLRGAPLPGTGDEAGQVWLAVGLKTVAQPLLAYLLGRYAVGLEGVPLLAVTVTSALPTAQNVFVYASAHGRGVVVARDAVLLSTLLSVPVLLVIALVLGQGT